MFSLCRLCQHPQYIQPLIDEAEAMLARPPAEHFKNMPLLESLLCEASRLDPLDSRKMK